MNNIQGATKVVGGYIQVDSVHVFILLDPSALHSFISTNLVKLIQRVECPTRKPLLVQTPVREVQVDQVCSNINQVINKENFHYKPHCARVTQYYYGWLFALWCGPGLTF